MAKESFHDLLSRAQDEARDVQSTYIRFLREGLDKTGNLDTVTPIPKSKADGIVPAFYIVDGVLNKFFIIIECKLEQSLENDAYRAGVILQTVCYLRQFKLKGEVIPRVALIGNKKQCFVLPVSCLQPYIDKDIAKLSDASNAYRNNPNIVKEIMQDDNITKHCHVMDITPDFSMDTVSKEIIALAKNQPLKLEIEENSISKVFDYFTMHILKEREVGYNGETKPLLPRIQKDLFMMMLLKPDDCFLHPNKPDTAYFGENNQRKVNRSAYIAFKNSYEFKYSKDEKKKFTEICDRLIEDVDRRNKGDFYTPTVWVDEAHRLLEKELGENWRQEYVVWDCCCGTKNLTRDYKFKELYSSTIEKGDIEIGKRYNLDTDEFHSVAFEYNFLEDDVELFEKLLDKKKSGIELTEKDFEESFLYYRAPELIKSLLEGKPIVFLINPPYGTAGNQKIGEDKKAGVAKTKINELMLTDKIGSCSQQLYAQFIYRINKLHLLFGVDTKLGLFSPPLFVSGSSFKGLRKYLSNYCSTKSGFVFQASQFADVKGNWGISFTYTDWSEPKYLDYCEMVIKSYENIKMNELGIKTLYNLDNKIQCSKWVKTYCKDIVEDVNSFTMSSGVKVSDGTCKISQDAIGYALLDTNIVEKNTSFCTILNRKMKGHLSSYPITKQNMVNILSFFAARRLITGDMLTWINCKDEYMIPNVEDLLYKEWEKDCIVYSLFNTASNQTSLRNINGVNMKNEFFFMSEKEMKDLANGKFSRDDINDAVATDIENFGGERFVYKKLQEIELSKEAQNVLNKARELVRLSFKNRSYFNDLYPKYQINCWDAGWYQIKGLLKEFHKDELEEFNKLYKILEDKMRPMVYELGFLK